MRKLVVSQFITVDGLFGDTSAAAPLRIADVQSAVETLIITYVPG